MVFFRVFPARCKSETSDAMRANGRFHGIRWHSDFSLLNGCGVVMANIHANNNL